MKKRWLAASLAALMALSMTACGGGKAAETTAAPTTAAPTTAAPSAGSNYGPGYTPETTAAHAETNQAPSDMGLIAPNGQ